MRTIRIAFYAIILFLFQSCHQERKIVSGSSDSLMVLDLSKKPEIEGYINASMLLSDLTYIPLQTTESSLIKSISKIILSGDRLFVGSGFDDILCFDLSGKHIYTLSSRGRGEGEYTRIIDFSVNNDSNSIYILSDNKILIYKVFDNVPKYDSSISTNYSYTSKISYIPRTGRILLSNDPITGTEDYLSVLVSDKGDNFFGKPNSYQFEKSDNYTRHMLNESIQFDMNGKIYFKEEFSDTAFYVSNMGGFIPGIVFNSHGHGLSPRIRYDSDFARNNSDDIFWVYSIMATKRFIIYSYENKKERSRIIYDLAKGKKYQIPLKCSIKDDISGGPCFDLSFSSQNHFFSFIDAIYLKQYVATDGYKNAVFLDRSKRDYLLEISKNLSDTDNPIVIIAKPLESIN